jgi:hypothetical protein
MSYIDLTADFGQFNLDTMGRLMTVNYLNQANAYLAEIEKKDASKVAKDILLADQDAQLALKEYQKMNYGQAATYAQGSYERVRATAAAMGIMTVAFDWKAGVVSELGLPVVPASANGRDFPSANLRAAEMLRQNPDFFKKRNNYFRQDQINQRLTRLAP